MRLQAVYLVLQNILPWRGGCRTAHQLSDWAFSGAWVCTSGLWIPGDRICNRNKKRWPYVAPQLTKKEKSPYLARPQVLNDSRFGQWVEVPTKKELRVSVIAILLGGDLLQLLHKHDRLYKLDVAVVRIPVYMGCSNQKWLVYLRETTTKEVSIWVDNLH